MLNFGRELAEVWKTKLDADLDFFLEKKQLRLVIILHIIFTNQSTQAKNLAFLGIDADATDLSPLNISLLCLN